MRLERSILVVFVALVVLIPTALPAQECYTTL